MPGYDPQQVALFRYQLIAPLVSLSGPRGTLKREMERITVDPTGLRGGQRSSVSSALCAAAFWLAWMSIASKTWRPSTVCCLPGSKASTT